MPPSLPRVPSGRFPVLAGTMGHSDSPPSIPPRFVAFAGRYRFVPVVRSRGVRALSSTSLDVLFSRRPTRRFERRRRGLPGSWGIPGVGLPCSQTPAELRAPGHTALECCRRGRQIDGLGKTPFSRLIPLAFPLAVYASQHPLPSVHARLASGWWPTFTGRDSDPQGSLSKGFRMMVDRVSRSSFPLSQA